MRRVTSLVSEPCVSVTSLVSVQCVSDGGALAGRRLLLAAGRVYDVSGADVCQRTGGPARGDRSDRGAAV